MSDSDWLQALQKDPLAEKVEAVAAQAEIRRLQEIADRKAAALEAKAREAQEAADRLVAAFPDRFHRMKEDLKRETPIDARIDRGEVEGGRRPSILPAQRHKRELEARLSYAREELQKRAGDMRKIVGDRAVEREFERLTPEREWAHHLNAFESENGFRERTHYESEAKGVVLSPDQVSDIEATRNARRMWHEGVHGPSYNEITGHISTARENGVWPLPTLHTGPGSTPQLNDEKYSYSDFIRDCEAKGRFHAAAPRGQEGRTDAALPQRDKRDVRATGSRLNLGKRILRPQTPSVATPIALPAQPRQTGNLQKPFQQYAPRAPVRSTSASPRFAALLTRAVGGVARWISTLKPGDSSKPGSKGGVEKAARSDVQRSTGPRVTETAARARAQGLSAQTGQAVDPVAALRAYLDKPLPPTPIEQRAPDRSANGSHSGRDGQAAEDLPINFSRPLSNSSRLQLVAAREREGRAARTI